MKIKSRSLSLPYTIIIGLLIFSACNRTEESITIEGGQITGTTGADPSIKSYLGIPFAAPPVGELRWKAPQPVKSWPGVRTADKLPYACIQT